jgi:hypothetical protein
MAVPMDLLEKQQREWQEQAANAERGRLENIRVFTRLWLGLGPDIVKVADGSRHDSELAEAKGLAAHRWNVLLNQEQQVARDEQALATRPKQRPPEHGDDLLPDRTIASRTAAYADETKARIAALADLRELVKNERKSLEALRIDFKRGR